MTVLSYKFARQEKGHPTRSFDCGSHRLASERIRGYDARPIPIASSTSRTDHFRDVHTVNSHKSQKMIGQAVCLAWPRDAAVGKSS